MRQSGDTHLFPAGSVDISNTVEREKGARPYIARILLKGERVRVPSFK